eukprot:Gregarina_sp_Poly_1__2546@NODE_168_length_12074_cov_98_169901_g149_i0_p8_GENE_NODE_168_length_12074_cov_98_169901_g149_i0NODE_168_length_12074_cov_98_169901_g149_i0_p8_ORF_typecomplete_len196_score35_01DUF4485/PF14846_6/0_072HsbA/PF12296_8/0_066HsbA/PF12296_8/1e04NCD1/PF04904_13/0_19DUF4930/PF16284_5/9_1e02DUF4930/PF16284_5/0_52_NODE_168_length_12074_cov_98_169901_g149_i01057311160
MHACQCMSRIRFNFVKIKLLLGSVVSAASSQTDSKQLDAAQEQANDDMKFVGQLTESDFKELFDPVDFDKKPASSESEKRISDQGFLPQYLKEWHTLAVLDYITDFSQRLNARFEQDCPKSQETPVTRAAKAMLQDLEKVYRVEYIKVLKQLPQSQSRLAHRWIQRLRQPRPTPREMKLLKKANITYPEVNRLPL